MNTLITYFNVTKENWTIALQQKNIRLQFILTLISYIFLFKYCRIMMSIFENRKGTQIFDPILAQLPSIDSSALIFTLTYTALTIFILSNLPNPIRFIKGLQAYTLLLTLRTITIFLVPLEPPIGMIVLKDTVSNFFMNSGGGGYIVKDLFFSGHVSAIMLFFFVAESKTLKIVLAILAVAIGCLILLQHVHYVMDVVAAPFFSFLALKTVTTVNKQFFASPIAIKNSTSNHTL
ncbi:MAG: phosphatase PAP2-related protein [Chitinophagales bacterium]